MTNIIQHLIDGLSLGSIYALTALGIGLIFGIVRLVNFAHAEFITVGAYALIVPSTDAVATMWLGEFHPIIVFLGVLITSSAVAVLSSIFVFRRFANASSAIMMIGSFTLGYVIQNVFLLVYGSRPKSVGLWSDLGRAVDFAGVHVPMLQLITLSATLIMFVLLTAFLNYSFTGIQIRAAAEDFRMARLLGVKANLLIAVAFGISGMLAGLVSLERVIQGGVIGYQMGLPVVLIAFIATVVGGMGSLQGAVMGGMLLGLISVALQVLLPIDLRPFRDAFVFGAVILLLVWRPGGIVRSKSLEERI